jgi:hypothetical protein
MLSRQALDAAAVRQLVIDQVEEGQRLDFKREAYAKHDKDEVRKDVVGMLNGGGGLLLLGVEEENHRAARVVPVADAEEHARWIEQVVNTGVEPYAVGLEVFTIDLAEDARVVAIRCTPGARTPYARTSQGRCAFFRRKGTEVLEMSLVEIREAFRLSELELARIAAVWNEDVRRVHGESTDPTLVVRIAPLLPQSDVLDPLDMSLRDFLWRPSRGQPGDIMGSLRPTPPPYGQGSNSVELWLNGLIVLPEHRSEGTPRWSITVTRHGEITLVARRIKAAEMFDPPKDAPEDALNPTPICIYPVSLAALAEDLYAHVGVAGPYAVAVALVRVRNAKLTDYVPYGQPQPRFREVHWRPSRNEDPLQVPQMQAAALAGEGPHPFFAPLQRLFNAFGIEAPPIEFFSRDGTLDPRVIARGDRTNS